MKPPGSPPRVFPLHLLTSQFIANAAHLWQGPQSTTGDKKPYLASSLSIILYYVFFLFFFFNMNALSQHFVSQERTIVFTLSASCHCSTAPHQSISKNVSGHFSPFPGVRGNKCLC